jgi:hypothetical protein
MRNRCLGVALLGVLLGAISGCGAGGQASGGPVVLPRQGLIRVVHVMPDAGRMTSFLSTKVFFAGQYADATVLQPELVGQYVMNILLTPPDNISTTLIGNEPVNLTDPDEVSFFMLGSTASPQTVRVDNIDIAASVTSKTPPASYPLPDFQILHGATRTGAVDVYVTDAAADLATATPTATVDFGDLTPLKQQDPAVTYRVRVAPAGSKTVLYDSGSFTTARLKRSMYLLLDNFGPGGESLRVANVTATGAENFPNQTMQTAMRVANMIPDAPVIDVYLGAVTGTPAFQNVAYGVTTAYQNVANGEVTVNITRAGDAAVVATGKITVVGGQALSVYASGLDADDTARFASLVESQRSINDQAQARFVVAAPSAGGIDMYLVSPGQPISDKPPVLASAQLLANTSVNLTPGSYDLYVTRTGTSVNLIGPEPITVAGGSVYSIVLLDAVGGAPGPLSVQFRQETLPP